MIELSAAQKVELWQRRRPKVKLFGRVFKSAERGPTASALKANSGLSCSLRATVVTSAGAAKVCGGQLQQPFFVHKSLACFDFGARSRS